MKKWLQKLGPWLAGPLIRLIGATLRVRVHDEAGALEKISERAYLFAFWHNRIAMLPHFYGKFFPGRQLAVMISRSGDGQMIADVVRQFNIQAVRGSSHRKPLHLFRESLRTLVQEGKDVGITPDGPRGPRYRVQPGIILLAQMSGYPILPVTYHVKWKLQFNSWDRFQVPLPFSRCDFYFLPPLEVPPGADEAEKERLRLELEKKLGE